MNHRRLLPLIVLVSAGWALSTAAQAQTWSALDLGVLGKAPVTASALNNAGQVAGNYTTTMNVYNTHGFITGANGAGITSLSNAGGTYSGASAINESGRVVGSSYLAAGGTYHAYITGANGAGMTDLGALAGGTTSAAYGINASGQVVGSANTNDGSHIFITDANGVNMRDLGRGAGNDINDAGQVTGVFMGNDLQQAFITDANGGNLRLLATLGGAYNEGLAINGSGQVVGDAGIDPGNAGIRHAFLTGANGVGMTDLGTLGGEFSLAMGINDVGQVVGYSTLAANSNNQHAFVTGANGVGMTDLNSLVSLANGAYFYTATDVNDLGQIVANASDGHAYLISGGSVVPEPASWALMALGMVGVGTGVRRARRTC